MFIYVLAYLCHRDVLQLLRVGIQDYFKSGIMKTLETWLYHENGFILKSGIMHQLKYACFILRYRSIKMFKMYFIDSHFVHTNIIQSIQNVFLLYSATSFFNMCLSFPSFITLMPRRNTLFVLFCDVRTEYIQFTEIIYHFSRPLHSLNIISSN